MSPLRPPYPFIREELKEGRVIPFLGAGASLSVSDAGGERSVLPSASDLADLLAQETEYPANETRDLSKVAQYYSVVAGRAPLQRKLHGIFDNDFPHTALHSFIASMSNPMLIVTTNYDDLIERALDAEGREYDVVIHTTDPSLGDRLLWWPHGEAKPTTVSPNKLLVDTDSVTIVYKMHGAVDRREAERDQYVITEDDYIDFLVRMTKRKAVPAIFAEPFQTRHFLFLGYGLRDWNLRVVLNRIEKDLRRPKGITSWAVQYEPSPLEQRFWQERAVEVYDIMIEDFVTQLASP